jgi:hypothetical protein
MDTDERILDTGTVSVVVYGIGIALFLVTTSLIVIRQRLKLCN